MSSPLRDRLRELEIDVQQLRVRPAADVRARGRRRGRHQMAVGVAAVAVVATTVGVAVTTTRDRPQPTVPAAAAPVLNCVLTLPDDPAKIRLRVLNGGASAQLARVAGVELRLRRFTVLTEAAGPAVTGTTLRYGPSAIGAATVMAAALPGHPVMTFDPTRGDDTIDLILGPGFPGLASTTELNQNLAAAGEPTAPPACR